MATKQQPINIGDRFQASNGIVWIVTERGLFGRPYWIVSEDRNRQTCLPRAVLETWQRLPERDQAIIEAYCGQGA